MRWSYYGRVLQVMTHSKVFVGTREPLTRFAAYCALAEQYHGRIGGNGQSEYPTVELASVARFTADRAERVHIYQWVQWLLDEQLAKAAAEIPLTQDLPIGVDPAAPMLGAGRRCLPMA